MPNLLRRLVAFSLVGGAVAMTTCEAGASEAPRRLLALAQNPPVFAPAPPPPSRPRMTVTIGAGATFDSSGFAPGVTKAVPSFAVVGDIGDGPAGFAMGVYASSAAGRYTQGNEKPVDRLGLDLMMVLRPFALRVARDNPRYLARVARALGAELGMGVERDGQSAMAGNRFGIHTGLRLDFPLTHASSPTDVRLRLAARHLVGLFEPLVGITTVRDATEATASIGVSF